MIRQHDPSTQRSHARYHTYSYVDRSSVNAVSELTNLDFSLCLVFSVIVVSVSSSFCLLTTH